MKGTLHGVPFVSSRLFSAQPLPIARSRVRLASRAEVEDIVAQGDRIFVQVQAWSRAAGSGVEVEQRLFHVWTVHDGKAARVELYDDKAQAREAVGLQE